MAKSDTHKAEKGIVGFFPGSFDLIHAGHCLAFEEAKKKCDYLVIGLQTDPTIDRPQKNMPVMTVKERLICLNANRYVDEVITYTTERELHFIDSMWPQEFKYDIRFMGADHKGKKHPHVKKRIVYVSRNHEYSSSSLRARIVYAEKGKMATYGSPEREDA